MTLARTKLTYSAATLAGLLVAAGPLPVLAQTPDLLTTRRLSAALASEIAAEAVASCARQGYAETVVVVDANGKQQALLRGDRAGSHTLDSAYHKAYTAATFKSDTTRLAEQAKKAPEFAALFTLPNLLPAGGGLVIKVGDEVIGAVGAAGAPGFQLDDGCAKAGVDKVRDRLK